MDMKTRAYVFLAITLFSGALLPILLAMANGANIYEFFLLVYAVSVPASLLFLAARGKLGELRDSVKDPKKLAIMCFTGIVTYLPIEFGIAFSEHYVSAALATAVFRVSPLLMLLMLPPLLRERLSKYQVAALTLAFIGLYIGISGGSLLGVFQNGNAGIVLFLIFMALAYALSMIMIKRHVVDIGVLITVASVTMFAIFLVLFAAEGMPMQALTITQAGVLLYTAVLFNVFGFFLYLTGLRPIKASVVANIFFLSPFISFIFAYLILGETIQLYYIAIALLAGAGIIIQSFDRKGGTYLASRKESSIRHMTVFDVTGAFANTGEVAISNTIRNGGRVLAVNIEVNHSRSFDDMMAKNGVGVYTDSHHTIRGESKFVKDIMGTGNNEFVVMKAGKLEECEKFFENLYEKIRSG